MKIDSVLKWGWKLTKYTSSQWDSHSIYHHHSNIHYNYTYMKQMNLTIIYYDQPSLIFHVEISNHVEHVKSNLSPKVKERIHHEYKKEGRSQQNSLHVGMSTFQIFYFSQGGYDNFTYPSSWTQVEFTFNENYFWFLQHCHKPNQFPIVPHSMPR